ncbi:MAG: hypothetical protein MSA90_00240 [Faecalicatena sp.]|nr:CD1871A family CXXC motif-containing protein [Faecalicatena sp.]MCI6463884.1 hypothetical protein [Faecalicatena sp.]MDY5620784.1 CD1871A family CXXC motif-containing protein [Lachnospiraceae bacterium]
MNKFIKRNYAGLMVFSLGIAFIAVGVYRDEIGTVFMKAAAICLECIGIG